MKPAQEHRQPVQAPAPAERVLEALALDHVVQRHAAAFGRVRAAGDWSDREFRRWVGPVLLAFTRHVHMLPFGWGDPPGSLLAEGLRRSADALLEPSRCACPGNAAHALDRSARLGQQIVIVARELVPLLGLALTRWRVAVEADQPMDHFERPLADRLQARAAARAFIAAVADDYRACPMDPMESSQLPSCSQAKESEWLGAALLLRSVPPALARLLATSGDSLLAQRAGCRTASPESASTSTVAGPATSEPAFVPDAGQLRSAMHALIASGRWVLNRRRARLWQLDGSLYLVWKTAASELRNWFAQTQGDRLAEREVADADRLLEAMQAAGLLAQGGDRLRAIRTPFTEALMVVELGDAQGWMRVLPLCEVEALPAGGASAG